MTTKQDRLNNIKLALDWHCNTNFNEDYNKKVKKLLKTLEKNNEFSMDNGKEEGWVSALLYIVGEDSDLFNQNNYLYNNEYYTKTELADGCSVSVSTMKSRAEKIRQYLSSNLSFKADISNFNNEFEENIFDEKYMKKAILEAKKKISPSIFKDLKGELWLEHDARPYMSLRKELAELYYMEGKNDKSIKELWELIELNIRDNQGNRFDLAVQLLEMNRFKDFERLVNMFEDDTSIFMIYSRALYAYIKEDTLESKRLIKEGFESNEYVPQILIGITKPKEVEGIGYTVGGEEEATIYLRSSIEGWIGFGEALFWLVDEYYTYKDKKGEPLSIKKEDIKEYMERRYFQ